MPSRRGNVASELDKLKYDAMISKTELDQFSDYLKARHEQVDRAIEEQTLGFYLGEKSKSKSRRSKTTSSATAFGGEPKKENASNMGAEMIEREL